MPDVPDLKIPRVTSGRWVPDKQEKKNLRYWKAKQAKRKPITRAEARRLYPDYSYDAVVKKLKDL